MDKTTAKVIVQSRAHIKKGIDKKFSATEKSDGTFVLVALDDGTKKLVSAVTFKKSYKVIENYESAQEVVANETSGGSIDDASGEVHGSMGRNEGADVGPVPEVEGEGMSTVVVTGIGSDGHWTFQEEIDGVPQPTIDNKIEESPPIKEWSLIPKYPNPEAQQKPMLQSQGENTLENSNSMRANRESRKSETPFKPKNDNYKLRQSMISSYLQCPSKFYEIYENGYSESSIFTRVGTAIHGIMEDYYNDPQNANVEELFEHWWTKHADADKKWYEEWRGHIVRYFDRHSTRNYKVIALEFEFDTMINGINASGTIDRIDRLDDRTIRIVDYKTNFKEFTTEELENSTQMQYYVLALEQLKDVVGDFDTVVCEYEMLRLGITQSVTFSREELDQFAQWVKMLYTKMLDGNDRDPRMNKYCGYCEMRHKCELYQDIVTSPTPPVFTEIMNLEDIAQQRDQLKDLEKVIKQRTAEIDEMIKQKIVENAGEVIIGGYKWSTKAGTRQVYNTQKVIDTLQALGKGDLIPQIATISATALKHNLKDEKDILQAIEDTRDITYISPSLNKSKIKESKK